MKNLFLSLKALPLLILFILGPGHAKTLCAQVTFSITASVNNNVNTGSFESTGLAETSGNFIELYKFNGKKTHSEVTLHYTNGTITAKTHCDIILTSASTATGSGWWIITKGTNAYSGISGSGTLILSVTGIGSANENISQQWSGSIK